MPYLPRARCAHVAVGAAVVVLVSGAPGCTRALRPAAAPTTAHPVALDTGWAAAQARAAAATGAFVRRVAGLELRPRGEGTPGPVGDSLALYVGQRVVLEPWALDSAGRRVGRLGGRPAYASDGPAVAVLVAGEEDAAVVGARPGRAVLTATMAWDGRVLRGRVVARVRPAAGVYARLAAGAREVEVRGHYTSGFEASAFAPCDDPTDWWWVESASPLPALRAALDAQPNVPAVAGFPGPPWRPKTVFVRWRGVVSDTGRWGHMGAAHRELRPDTVLEARPPGPVDCSGAPSRAARAAPARGAPNPLTPAGRVPAADPAAAARRRWAERGPADYDVTVTRDCECLPEESGPVRVTVRAGAVASRVYARTGAPVPAALGEHFPSVDGLFARMDAARTAGAARVRAAYDPALGYPTRVFIDADSVHADDEVTYVAGDLRAAPSAGAPPPPAPPPMRGLIEPYRAAVAGQVVGEDGRPVTGAVVLVYLVPPRRVSTSFPVVQSDAAGRFRLEFEGNLFPAPWDGTGTPPPPPDRATVVEQRGYLVVEVRHSATRDSVPVTLHFHRRPAAAVLDSVHVRVRPR